MSIRLRLVLWYSTIFAIGVTAFSLIVYFGVRSYLVGDLDQFLTRQSDGFQRFMHSEVTVNDLDLILEEAKEFATGLPEDCGIELSDAHGRVIYSTTPSRPSTDDFQLLHGDITIGDSDYHYVLWRSLDDTTQAL